MEVSVLGVLLCVCMLDVVAAICPSGTYGYGCGYQCHCNLTKCDPANGCNSGDCDTGWSGLTCQKGNMALKKDTSASSVYKEPRNAVNGDTRANSADVCFHSRWDNAITEAWWRVDLGQEILIQNVTIYFRTDYIVRRNGIQIYIADTAASSTDGVNCYNVTGNRNGTDIPDVLNVTCSGEGRYLVLYTTTVNDEFGIREPMLDFCEVEVDVCSNGTFGANCDNYCHCDGQVCDYVSGVCPGGVCLPGWATEMCDTECESGHYGANCRGICPNRNSSCDHVTGTCAEGCKAGWNGTDCTQKCLQSYGDGCSKMCSERNCDGTSPDNCDHVTRKCESGCRPGWKDSDCTEACIVDVEYGANCVGACSPRMCEGGNVTCPRDTGRCESGCQSGWKGEDCNQVCSFGTFGVNCTGVCGQCLDLSSCHHDNGTCLTGCSDGWTNHACTEKTKNNNAPLIHSISLVIGLVVGVVMTLLLGGAVLLYLLRRGTLAWARGNVKDGDRRDTVDRIMTLADNYTSISELPSTDGRNTQDNDYAELDEDTRTDNKHYDVIQNKVYVNTHNKQPQNILSRVG